MKGEKKDLAEADQIFKTSEVMDLRAVSGGLSLQWRQQTLASAY